MLRTLPLPLVILSLGLFAWTILQGIDDPMNGRQERLETRLTAIASEPKAYTTPVRAEITPSYESIHENTALWQELIVAPARPSRPVRPPDMRKKLEGVVVTRASVGSGDTLKVLIKSTDNPRGTFMGVGEKVNGTTILRIDKRSVLFVLKHQGKSYVQTIARR